MSFVSRPTLVGRVPRLARGMGAFLGDAVASSNVAEGSSVEQLQLQVNRFTMAGGAPVHLRASAAPVPITGELDSDTITMAVWIMQSRAAAAHVAWNDGASADLLREALTAWKDPRGYVTKNLSRITQTIRLYADKNGIPPASGKFIGMTPSVVVGVLTAGALAFMFFRTKGHR